MKKQLILILKIALGVACFTFLYYKLNAQLNKEKLESLRLTLSQNNSIVYLIIALLLLAPNWMIESYKWKRITNSIEPISFWQALSGVLAGVCVGNLTPGRFGEFAGRILYFSPENRSKVAVTHFVCGATQLTTTMVFGVICSVLWLTKTDNKTDDYTWVLIPCITILIALFLIIWNVEKIYAWLSLRSMFQKLNLGQVSYPRKILMELLLWSVIRYTVFSIQYILVLKCCGASGTIVQLFIPVAIFFMLLSALPMISFIEVAVRAGVAILLFAGFNTNDLLIVTASTLLWLINLMIPSILGYFIILSKKIKTSDLIPKKR